MDNFNLEKMSEVWSRVTATPEIGAVCSIDQSNEPAKICGFISKAQRLSFFYEALARKSRVKCAQFRRLASEERRNVRRLQTAYFILTGDTCTVGESNVEVNSLLDALRKAYIEENANADAYRKAEIESKTGSVAELFSTLADRETDHAIKLRDMIAELMN